MKTIGLIADTHIPTRCKALSPHVVNAFANADLILHAGDLITPELMHQLEQLAPVIAVAGNHDRKKNRFTPPLPNKRTLTIEGYTIGLVHGDSHSGRSPYIWERAYQTFQQQPVDIIVFGHTHNPMILTDGRILLINPGSAGYTRNYTQNSFAKLLLEPGLIKLEMFYFELGNETISHVNTISFQPGILPLTIKESRRLYW